MGGPDPEPQSLPEAAIPQLSESSLFQSSFASLSLHRSDRIRLLQFPEPIIPVIVDIVTLYWTSGVMNVRPSHGSCEITLGGSPWRGAADDAITARRLMYRILESLYNHGWVLYISTDLSKTNRDTDTLLFRHQVPTPAPQTWVCISFSNYNEVRFIDAPNNLVMHFVNIFSDQSSKSWLKGPNVWAISLKHANWRDYSDGKAGMEARRVALKLIEGLEAYGFTVYASIDQKISVGERSETDTWHCCRPINWTPGTPVYHH